MRLYINIYDNVLLSLLLINRGWKLMIAGDRVRMIVDCFDSPCR